MNIEQARFNMIEQQVRPWEVLEPRVLETLQSIPREEFVPVAQKDLAFADIRMPIACNEEMMTPTVEGRLLQALQIQNNESVLEIGTGSGFMTACLAKLSANVKSYELHDALSKAASDKLKTLGLENVELCVDDGLNDNGSYDIIVVTAGMQCLSDSLNAKLKDGGRLFVITGEGAVMTAQLISKTENGFDNEALFETELKLMPGQKSQEQFSF